MPRALDPDNRFDLWLDTDADKPEAERPVFVGKYLTGREFERMDAVTRGASDNDTTATVMAFYAALRIGIVDWRNMPEEFDAEKLADYLTPGEAAELLKKLGERISLSGDDPKGSASP